MIAEFIHSPKIHYRQKTKTKNSSISRVSLSIKGNLENYSSKLSQNKLQIIFQHTLKGDFQFDNLNKIVPCHFLELQILKILLENKYLVLILSSLPDEVREDYHLSRCY